ncbi:MAG: hypothetical protein LBN93_02630 [Candidatus Symbiothrix sp.]|jgi:hypothetical protein|nr:hypothetical protein [Candidatus Symbiothrix sp.]
MKKTLLIGLLFLMLLTAQGTLVAQNKGQNAVPVAEVYGPELSLTDKNVLIIKNATVGSKLEIITIVGNKVRQIELKTPDSSYELNLPKAIYIFKLEGVVRRFVIK